MGKSSFFSPHDHNHSGFCIPLVLPFQIKLHTFLISLTFIPFLFLFLKKQFQGISARGIVFFCKNCYNETIKEMNLQDVLQKGIINYVDSRRMEGLRSD